MIMDIIYIYIYFFLYMVMEVDGMALLGRTIVLVVLST